MSKDKRLTEYVLTIHKEDTDRDGKPLYDRLERYCKDLFSNATECYFIKHDNDITEDGEIKTEHIHLAIKTKYNQGRTFATMKTYFPMSHIEPSQNWNNSVLYLTHETINAIEDNKTRYDRNKVVNVFGSDISKYYDKPLLETFDFEKIETYIIKDKMTTIIQYGRRFGYSIIYPKWHTIKEIINELRREEISSYKGGHYEQD